MLGGFSNCPVCGNARMLVQTEIIEGRTICVEGKTIYVESETIYKSKCATVGCTNCPAYVPKFYRRGAPRMWQHRR
jgi:hypothetical protein